MCGRYDNLIPRNVDRSGHPQHQDSAKRLDAGRALAKEHGCVLENFFMTMGGFDNVAVVDAPDDESLAKYVLTLGSEGNLRTVTLKAFPEETYRTIIGTLA